VFSVLAQDGSGFWSYPSSFTNSRPVRQMVIGSGSTLVFGRDVSTGRDDMTWMNLLATKAGFTLTGFGSWTAAPVLGANGFVYTASVRAMSPDLPDVMAWSPDMRTMYWRLHDSIGPVVGSPALDCARGPDGSASPLPVGTLYVPNEDGRLYAFVVDSRGLDSSAPWPKFQHDARNTGNPATPISSCP
jgi:hypothetical protein